MLFRPCLPRLLFAATRHYKQCSGGLESTIRDCPVAYSLAELLGPIRLRVASLVALRVANMRARSKTQSTERNFHVQRSCCLAR
jgi:hypothetical protein